MTGINFGLASTNERFYYPSFFPNFEVAQKVIDYGATVEIACSDGRSGDIWSLKVGQVVVADFEGIKRSHRSNGNWALVCAIGFAAAVAGLKWVHKAKVFLVCR